VWEWLSAGKAVKGADAKALSAATRKSLCRVQALHATREARGAIDFDSIELAIEFDDKGTDRADRAGAAQ
jgi:exoribonuclease R